MICTVLLIILFSISLDVILNGSVAFVAYNMFHLTGIFCGDILRNTKGNKP